MKDIMTKLQEYTNGGFELNEHDYHFNDIYFVGTCGSFPEQYDCYITDSEGEKFQVGYVRLRGGYLTCQFSDVGCETIYEYLFESLIGSFRTENERLFHLDIISSVICNKLVNIGVFVD